MSNNTILRSLMSRLLLALPLAAALVSSSAFADLREDCELGEADDCTKLIRQNPRDAYGYYRRGIKYSVDHQHERALADFSKAIEIDPRKVDYWLWRADVRMGTNQSPLEDYRLALADTAKAIEVDPSSAAAYAARCHAHVGLLDKEHATADCEKALSLAPNVPTAKMWAGAASALPSAAAMTGTPMQIRCTFKNDASVQINNIELTNTLAQGLGRDVVIKWTAEFLKPPKQSAASRNGVYVTRTVTAAGARIGEAVVMSAPFKSCSAAAVMR
jgi:tetratricopeptide (TPR) repeat protein